MEKRVLLFSFIIGLLCGASAVGVTDSSSQIQSLDVSIKEVPADISTTLEPQITTISPHITSEKTPETSVKPDEKTTSSTSTTSTPAPTTTTEKTSTAPVTTTTEATTTTSTTPVPTTTTPAPTPTPTPTPTPSPTPTPKPPVPQPEVATWTTPCILLQLSSQLNITYKTKDNKTENILYNIPLNATVEDSNCEANGSQQIQVNWNTLTGQNSYAFFFVKNDTSFYLYIIRLVIEISDDIYPNAVNQTLHLFYQSTAKSNFRTPINMSYHCTRKQSLNLARTLNETESAGTLTISHVQMEAFHTGDSKKFSTAKDCDASEVSDAVPIAVGVSLAVLILIMLIAYLVARRSSSARGYMSF